MTKKPKFNNISSQEGSTDGSVLLEGRRSCSCQATKHDLINNCLSCGKVICKQEGMYIDKYTQFLGLDITFTVCSLSMVILLLDFIRIRALLILWYDGLYKRGTGSIESWFKKVRDITEETNG